MAEHESAVSIRVTPKRIWAPVFIVLSLPFAWVSWQYDDLTLIVPTVPTALAMAWAVATGSLVLDRDRLILRYPPMRSTVVALTAAADASWKRSPKDGGTILKRFNARSEHSEIRASTWFWSDLTVLARKAQATISVARDQARAIEQDPNRRSGTPDR